MGIIKKNQRITNKHKGINLNDEDMSLISKLDTLESQFFSHYNPAVVERINNLHR